MLKDFKKFNLVGVFYLSFKVYLLKSLDITESGRNVLRFLVLRRIAGVEFVLFRELLQSNDILYLKSAIILKFLQFLRLRFLKSAPFFGHYRSSGHKVVIFRVFTADVLFRAGSRQSFALRRVKTGTIMLHLDLRGLFFIRLVVLLLKNASVDTKEEGRPLSELAFAGDAAQRVKFFYEFPTNNKS